MVKYMVDARSSIKIFIAIAVISTAIVLAAASTLLQSGQEEEASAVSSTTHTYSVDSSLVRPDCPEGINLPCLGGNIIPRQSGDTRPMLVNVWAWWCQPCKAELPIIEEFARTRTDIQVVGVHADPNGNNGAAMLTDLGIDLPSYQDSTNYFASTYEIPSVVPVTLLLGADGHVIARFIHTFDSLDILESEVNAALAHIS